MQEEAGTQGCSAHHDEERKACSKGSVCCLRYDSECYSWRSKERSLIFLHTHTGSIVEAVDPYYSLDFTGTLWYNDGRVKNTYTTTIETGGRRAMNIWDSVQRGLEKASQEAARIAKTQRLRSTIDNLSRQIQTQQGMLIQRAMELFAQGQLTQSELSSICQDLANMQQQFAQAQAELKLTQSQSVQPTPQGNTPGLLPPASPIPGYTSDGEAPPVNYAPPPNYQFYSDTTVPIPAPPPPPGVDPQTISAFNTVLMDDAALPTEEGKLLCTACHSELIEGNAYCHNCGTPVLAASSYPPTVRGSIADTPQVEDQETVRASEEPSGMNKGALHSEDAQAASDPNQATLQDGGH